MNEVTQPMSDEKSLEVRKKPTTAYFDLSPRNLPEAMELAKLMADSDLVPKDYKGKPGNVLIAVQMGQEVGLKPMAAIQNIAVINGRPSLWGDAGKALLLDAGFEIEEADAEEIRKSGVARCTITRPGRKPVSRTFSMDDAKRAGLLSKDTYKNYLERMLAWRAFWFAARDAASDILKGLGGAEEIEDYPEPRNITAEAEAMMPRSKSGGDAPTAAATEQPRQATADGRTRFKLFGREYDTAGFTAEQMKESFRLEAMLESKAGKGTVHRILAEDFNVQSRNDLDEETGAAFVEKLRTLANGDAQEEQGRLV